MPRSKNVDKRDSLQKRRALAVGLLASELPGNQILKPNEISTTIREIKQAHSELRRVADREILQALLRQSLLLKAKLDFPHRAETRYFVAKPNHYILALTLARKSYLTHLTASYLHGLSIEEPSVVYVNSEQGEKRIWDAELTQDSIDQAFQARPRHSKNAAKYDKKKICLLNGKFTGRLGVTIMKLADGEQVHVTDLERTLIDIAVRPHYSGGVSEVIEAYRRAGRKVSIQRIADYLNKLSYVYPYHQAIGFYLDSTGEFSKAQLSPIRAIAMELKFYLAHQMKQVNYSSDWRVYYPRNLQVKHHAST